MEKGKTETDTLIPAFESSIGLMEPTKIMVSEKALKEVNKQVAPVARYAMDSANIASLYAKRAVRPDEIAALRRAMFNVVHSNLGEVEQVIRGEKQWKASQVRLYALLTERVIPKMQSIALEDNTKKKVEDLSIEELEALALGKKREIQEQLNTIDITARDIEKSETYKESAETKREVLRELAHIEALDDAERKYVARLACTTPAVAAEEEAKRRAKFQPSHTEEQLAKVRKKNVRPLDQRWRDMGYSEEEIKEKMAEVIRKRSETRKRNNRAKQRELGYGMGLDYSQQKIAEDIRSSKNKTLKEFRVNPLKGRRSKSVVQREIEIRMRKELQRKEREENPRIKTTGKPFGIEEDLTGIRLREFKEKYPEVFHVSEEDREALRQIDRETYERRKQRRNNSAGSGEVSAEDTQGGSEL